MYEAIITFVAVRSTSGTDGFVSQYPETKVYRVEFDTETGFNSLMTVLHSPDGERLYDIANVERLKA